eukprot:TRINITY_DN14408_c0_g1_i1.p1 TRINITY_DN14408_c0_g1~~TRINITY_DN14408_c0_g1_i1.p1  ORF type:complete len:259 (+),score=24.55 TRINITY_DN14408_c0_g1_i1:268-1044(+)
MNFFFQQCINIFSTLRPNLKKPRTKHFFPIDFFSKIHHRSPSPRNAFTRVPSPPNNRHSSRFPSPLPIKKELQTESKKHMITFHSKLCKLDLSNEPSKNVREPTLGDICKEFYEGAEYYSNRKINNAEVMESFGPALIAQNSEEIKKPESQKVIIISSPSALTVLNKPPEDVLPPLSRRASPFRQNYKMIASKNDTKVVQSSLPFEVVSEKRPSQRMCAPLDCTGKNTQFDQKMNIFFNLENYTQINISSRFLPCTLR